MTDVLVPDDAVTLELPCAAVFGPPADDRADGTGSPSRWPRPAAQRRRSALPQAVPAPATLAWLAARPSRR